MTAPKRPPNIPNGATVGRWKLTPVWLRWFGKNKYRRLWDWGHVGGCFCEWEYADGPLPPPPQKDEAMSETKDEILVFLDFAIRKDAANGGIGTRSTREVAERIAAPMEATRRRLRQHAVDGLVDEYGLHSEPAAWRITGQGRAALSRASSGE